MCLQRHDTRLDKTLVCNRSRIDMDNAQGCSQQQSCNCKLQGSTSQNHRTSFLQLRGGSTNAAKDKDFILRKKLLLLNWHQNKENFQPLKNVAESKTFCFYCVKRSFYVKKTKTRVDYIFEIHTYPDVRTLSIIRFTSGTVVQERKVIL